MPSLANPFLPKFLPSDWFLLSFGSSLSARGSALTYYFAQIMIHNYVIGGLYIMNGTLTGAPDQAG
jgi:hypothetical protein